MGDRGTFVAPFNPTCTIPAAFCLGHKIGMSQREDPRHNLRMPPDLRKRLKLAAVENERSMNAELLARLEKSLEPDPAALIAEALKPISEMSAADRKKLGQLFSEIGELLAKASGEQPT